MADGSDGPDVSPEEAAAAPAGEIWGTLEELLLACAVSRHGTGSWDSVATEVQTRSPLAARPRLTARSCRLRFHHLHRRFSVAGAEEEAGAEGEGEDPDASAADGWLDELRRLRVAELRREVERCDLSIGTLQTKVEQMKEERERSLSGEAKKEEVTGEDNLSGEEPGRSCRESNSTDLKRPKNSGDQSGVKEEEDATAKLEEFSGESMAASKESSASQRRRRKASAGDEESEEASVQSQPLAALLDRVAARFGSVFERLHETQESESYRGTIRRHVDLETMRRKLDGPAGYTSSEFYRDLLLLCANASVYLPRHGTAEHAAAAVNALRLVSAQVSATLREPKRDLQIGKSVTAASGNNNNNLPSAAAAADSRRAEAGGADVVGPLIEKTGKPLIFCRKRSSIAKASAAAAVARKEEEDAAKVEAEKEEGSDGEKKAAAAVATKDKAWGTRAKKTRGPNKNAGAAGRKASKAAAAAEEAETKADKKKDDADSDGATAAGGLVAKKRNAVDFLKRLNQGASSSTKKKRGSPLVGRKRSAAAAAAQEEEQPKARRGPGKKGTGRGGSKSGARAAGTKRSVGRPPQKRGAAPATPPPSKRAKVNRSERSSSSSRRGGRK